jgi:hypothetical protein
MRRFSFSDIGGLVNWVHCFRCGVFKSCPAAKCTVCGHEAVPYGYDPYDFDRDYGHYPDQTHDHSVFGGDATWRL